MVYIKDIEEGQKITAFFLCSQKQSLKTKSGKDYLSLKLQDKTGILDAKVWDLSNQIEEFEQNDFVKVEGLVITYRDGKQLNVHRIRKAESHEYDMEDYVAKSEYDIDEMYDEIKGYIKEIKDLNIKALAEEIFINDEVIKEKFINHSAAKTVHHNYLGGLLEHTLSIVKICKFAASNYESVNEDLLIISALLHDIGKIYELSELPYNDYTDEGQLIGHIVMAVEIINEKTSKISNFPKELKTLIKHCILSHHGRLEYGSPKVPSTIEAIILHFADNMDSKVKTFEKIIKNSNKDEKWTNYDRILSRRIRKTEF